MNNTTVEENDILLSGESPVDLESWAQNEHESGEEAGNGEEFDDFMKNTFYSARRRPAAHLLPDSPAENHPAESPSPVEETEEDTPVFPPALDIATLNEEEYLARIREIEKYVSELALQFNFNDRTIPPCWKSHLALVAILSGLYGSYKCCFNPVGQAGQVFDYIRNLETARVCLERLVQNTSCATGEHKSWELSYWAGAQLEKIGKAWWKKYL